ncbi:hypothetical protein SB57_10745, partial [Lactobacillus delbrueckii subsp. bulgaricus]
RITFLCWFFRWSEVCFTWDRFIIRRLWRIIPANINLLPKARTGNLMHNPVHKDMVYAARTAKLAFIINVVLDEDKKIIGSFAGDMEAAHKVGCDFV